MVYLIKEQIPYYIAPMNVALFKTRALAELFVSKHKDRKFYICQMDIVKSKTQFRKIYLQKTIGGNYA